MPFPTPDSPRLRRARRVLLIVLLVSLIPALLLAYTRVRYEQATRTVAVVMDYPALVVQARTLGQTPAELLAHYRELGVNTVAVYEDVVANRVQDGEIIRQPGFELFAEHPEAGFKPSWAYFRNVEPGVLEGLRERFTYRSEALSVDGQNWVGWPVDISSMPAGPDEALIAELREAGFQVAYRPYDMRALRDVAADWPQVPYLIFNGLKVPGADNPARLKLVEERLGERTPAIIEGTPQKGLDTLIHDRPALRLFAINPAWQAVLQPDELASKYVLAARERNLRLLYVRPFETLEDTERFLTRVQAGLERAGITVGQPALGIYQPSMALRYLSLLGPLVALVLLAVSYPLPRLGLLVAAGTLALVAAANLGSPLGAGALLASVTFPALGFVMRRSRPSDWLLATAFSLIGVLFVAALGTDRQSMLGLHPFRGVGLTLIVPLGLFALSLLPRQDLRKTATDLYHYPLKLGDVAIIVVVVAALALMVVRRGNTPAIGVSAVEEKVRGALQDNLIRPRFKEIVGHPAAILGLSGRFPPYVASLLLMGGVVGQASILNTFAHFHTPLLISGQRAVNGILIGGLIGFLLLPLLAWTVRYLRDEVGLPFSRSRDRERSQKA